MDPKCSMLDMTGEEGKVDAAHVGAGVNRVNGAVYQGEVTRERCTRERCTRQWCTREMCT